MIAKIEFRYGEPVITVDGVPLPPMAMTTQAENSTYLKGLGDAGIRMFFIICDTEWISPRSTDKVRRDIERILAVVPDAYFMLRIGLHPSDEWIKANPDQLLTYSDGSHVPVHLYTESYHSPMPGMYSLCSQKWRLEATAKLYETLDIIDAFPFADRIIGFFLAAGGTSEWYYLSSMTETDADGKPIVADMSEAFREEFGSFLRAKYGSLENLRRQWKRPNADFDHPIIPPFEERRFGNIYPLMGYGEDEVNGSCEYGATNYGVFLNPDACQDVSDFYRAWNLGTANSIIHFASAIKTRYNNERLVGAFGGGYGCCSYLESSSLGGVIEELNSGVVDFMATPGTYINRWPGGVTALRVMQDSFRLRGRIFINEEDTRTHRDAPIARDGMRTYTADDTVNVMKRDFGRNICDGTHAWWFDQTWDRYYDDRIMELIAVQQQIARECYGGECHDRPQIAVIYDQESIGYVSESTSLELCDYYRTSDLYRIGAPYACHFHNDFALPNMPDYKLYIFVNCMVLTDVEREQIHAALRRSGGCAVWLYGQGIINPDSEPKFSIANIEQLTGFHVTMSDKTAPPRFKLSGEHGILALAERGHIYGCIDREIHSCIDPSAAYLSGSINPRFISDDPSAEILGRFCMDGNAALAYKRMDGWDSVFCGGKTLRSDLLRSIAAYEGVHIYSDSDDIMFAGHGFVTLHASVSGSKTLTFAKPCSPYEVYEKRYYAHNTTSVSFDMYEGQTLMFAIK